MKYFIFLPCLILLFAQNPKSEKVFKTKQPQSTQPLLRNGTYLPNSVNYHSMNDSIRVKNDSLIVYKDPGYGYGVFFIFNYTYKRINDTQLVLHGISHFMDSEPGTSFARVEEFEWHQDTLRLKFTDTSVLLLFEGLEIETYKLNTIE